MELYKTPFSRAYWKQACRELKSPRMLIIAALIVALRVALKTGRYFNGEHDLPALQAPLQVGAITQRRLLQKVA